MYSFNMLNISDYKFSTWNIMLHSNLSLVVGTYTRRTFTDLTARALVVSVILYEEILIRISILIFRKCYSSVMQTEVVFGVLSKNRIYSDEWPPVVRMRYYYDYTFAAARWAQYSRVVLISILLNRSIKSMTLLYIKRRKKKKRDGISIGFHFWKLVFIALQVQIYAKQK